MSDREIAAKENIDPSTVSCIVRRYGKTLDFDTITVTIQRIVAGLGLSQSGVEFSACLEVSFFSGLEPFRQFVSMAV